MAYIYKIENIITGEKYIGNTQFSITKRWKEHCHDAKSDKCKNRPIYTAINKYGKDNFTISVIEECDNSIADDREKYWIEQYDTFNNGYNSTYGGKGKAFVNYDLVLMTYKKTLSIKQTAEQLGVCVDTVSDVLDLANIKKLSMREIKKPNSRPVIAISAENNDTTHFQSIHAASEWIHSFRPYLKSESSIRLNIVKVCNNKMKHAYGYVWKYADVV